ncbi:MAG: tetratricopeptide repeat protein [Phycisphaerales bacterium]|jgi:tetratricopeptide (TPR) repeat protein|nr:tetratricopeptide repeat protein [Phycisphaerales bacterium]
MPSIAQLEKLLTIDPEDPFVHYGLAQELAKSGELDRAIESYSKVIELDPNYCYAYYFKGQTLDQLGKQAEAKSIIAEGIEAAKQVQDGKALSELSTLLQSVT